MLRVFLRDTHNTTEVFSFFDELLGSRLHSPQLLPQILQALRQFHGSKRETRQLSMGSRPVISMGSEWMSGIPFSGNK